jgi:hypothetical protein
VLGRVATYGIPSVAVAIAAIVLLGPGARRDVVGARVRARAIEGTGVLALRLEAFRRAYGVDDAIALRDVRVEAHQAGEPVGEAHASIGDDGAGEARIEAASPLHGAVEVRVTSASGAVLAEGSIALSREDEARREAPAVRGGASGALAIAVLVPRGQLAAPFPGELAITVTRADGSAVAGGEVELDAPGAALAPDHVTLDAQGRARVAVIPRAHTIELTATAHDAGGALAGAEGRWVGALPVVPGALWLSPSNDTLTIRSPSPRARAYVSIEGPEGRMGGLIVPLAPDAEGFASASLANEDVPGLAGRDPSERRFVVLAGDPGQRGSGTVAWPLAPDADRVTPPPLDVVLDGLPAAERREAERAAKARFAGALVIGAAALVEALLLVLRTRRAQRKLEAHLAAATAGASESEVSSADRENLGRMAREHPILQASVLAAVVLLAFAIVGALATFR